MRFILYCLFLLVMAAWASAAENCRPVDLRDALGDPIDQGNTGFCFAHTSADLIGFKLGIRVSPLQLGANYVLANPEELNRPVDAEVRRRVDAAFVRDWRKDRSDEPQNFAPERILTMNGIVFTGGEEKDAILLANFFGLCPAERLPSTPNAFPRYLEEIRRYHDRRLQGGSIPPEEYSGPIGEVLDPAARAMAWSFRHWVDHRCGSYFYADQPLLPDSVQLGQSLEDVSKRFPREDADKAQAKNKILRAINAALDRQIPVSIGYSSNDIMPRDPRVPDGDHASVLAGRKEMDGECFYFLRNSFGEAKAKDYLPPFQDRLEHGGLWLRLSELPSLYSVLWLN
jgi:hypothetical protein